MQRKSSFFLSSLFLSLSFSFSSSVGAQDYDPSRVIVKLAPEVEISEVTTLKSTRLLDEYYVIQTSDAAGLVKQLSSNPNVEKVSLNYKRSVGFAPQDPSKRFFKSLVSDPFFNDVRATKLWAFDDKEENGIDVNKYYAYLAAHPEIKKSPVLVAVVDTGADLTHPDLQGKFWVNKKEVAGNGIDDDKNGYVDDVNGINTLQRNPQNEATGNVTLDPGPCTFLDCSASHGTHVSGTIAAVQNNKIGVAGISSEAKLISIKTVPTDGDETDIDVAESYAYAAKMGARVINCSFGKAVNEGGNMVNEMITTIAKKYNVLVVIAAGNSNQNIDTTLTYPASYPNPYTVVVGASTSGGSRASFSNYGIKNVDIFAPGQGIVSSVKGGYQSFDGTSMAAPHVAGVAAEILSVFPKLNVKELKDVLLKSAVLVPSYEPLSVSGGLLNVMEAYNYAAKNYPNKR
ncbi:MAG: S8 family peptidase [Bacteriovoracaceae bacterium]|nr:S8 family peptidase [Bacteriovoracaceae bacterium]